MLPQASGRELDPPLIFLREGEEFLQRSKDWQVKHDQNATILQS
jgi:hypothetical protein